MFELPALKWNQFVMLFLLHYTCVRIKKIKILNLTQHMQVMIELRDIWTTNRYVCWQEKLDMISIVDYTLPQAFFDFQIELKYTKIYFKNRTNHNYDLSENLLLTIPIELRKCQQKDRCVSINVCRFLFYICSFVSS